jgi:hypothetical protein
LSPPYWWNGSIYEVDDSQTDFGVGNVMTAVGSAGEVVSFALDNLIAITEGESNVLTLSINNVVVATFPLSVAGSASYTSDILSDGDEISFDCVEMSGGSPYNIYGVDFSITPTPDTPSTFWTDLIGCTQL